MTHPLRLGWTHALAAERADALSRFVTATILRARIVVSRATGQPVTISPDMAEDIAAWLAPENPWKEKAA